jgi:transcriptional regulator with XRE-family HTH domain
MDYGRAIRTARGIRRLTQRRLAGRIGIDSSYLSLIEANKRVPSLDVLERLSKVVKIPLYVLFLMGSEASELRGISKSQAQELSANLLSMIVGSGGPLSDRRKK